MKETGKRYAGKKYVSSYVEVTIAAEGKVFDFVNNSYIAKNEEECAIIERCKGYGKYIYALENLVDEPKESDNKTDETEKDTPTPFACDLCGETFESKEMLTAHAIVCPANNAKDGQGEDGLAGNAKNDNPDSLSFKCELCGKEFPTVQALNGHMASCRRKHEEN